MRKDAVIDVELTSTGTQTISWIELGVFLGASLKSVAETRASALPTTRHRDLADGGIAFRAEASALITPGSTRLVRLERTALPLDRDFSTVNAVIADCRELESAGEATVQLAQAEQRSSMTNIAWIAAALAVLIALTIVVLWLRY